MRSIVIWDEAEDTDKYSDGPIFFFLLLPGCQRGGKSAYTNKIHYDHSFDMKTMKRIFNVRLCWEARQIPRRRI